MRIKDNLILREVAGQYVIVPIGKRVNEITSIVYITESAAFLWNSVKDKDFTEDDLVHLILNHYEQVTESQARADVRHFIQVLSEQYILDDGTVRGRIYVRASLENDTK